MVQFGIVVCGALAANLHGRLICGGMSIVVSIAVVV